MDTFSEKEPLLKNQSSSRDGTSSPFYHTHTSGLESPRTYQSIQTSDYPHSGHTQRPTDHYLQNHPGETFLPSPTQAGDILQPTDTHHQHDVTVMAATSNIHPQPTTESVKNPSPSTQSKDFQKDISTCSGESFQPDCTQSQFQGRETGHPHSDTYPDPTSNVTSQLSSNLPRTLPNNGSPPAGDIQKDVSKDVPAGQTQKMIVIALVAFFVSCAGRFHSPLLTQYVYQVYTGVVYGNDSVNVHISKHPCVNNSQAANHSKRDPREDEVQDKSADLLMLLEVVAGSIAIVSNLFLGSYSDVLGRRFVLLVPILGHFLRDATAPVIIYWDLGLPALYVGYALDGLLGGSVGIMVGFYLYAVDITRSDHQRTMGMAIIKMTMELTDAAFNILAGWFIQDYGFFYASLIASALLFVATILVVCLPETVPRNRRRRRMSPVKAVKRVFGVIVAAPGAGDHPHQRTLLLLAFLAFVFYIVPGTGGSKLMSLFLMKEPFCWSSMRQGVFSAASDAISMVISFSIIALVKKCLPDPYLAMLGAASVTGGKILMGLSRNDLMVYMVPVVTMASSTLSPATRSIMSRMVAPDKQGALFSSLAVVESVCICFGEFAFMTIYKSTVSIMPGFTFFVCGSFYLCIVIIYCIYICLLRSAAPKQTERLIVQCDAQDEEEPREHRRPQVVN